MRTRARPIRHRPTRPRRAPDRTSPADDAARGTASRANPAPAARADRPADPRTPSRCRLRAATPARRAPAPPPVDAGEGVGQRRAHTVAGLPVVGDPVRRQPQDARRQSVHPNRGQNQEAVVADNPIRIRHPRVRRPADHPVARSRPAARGGKTDAYRPAVRGRHDPVPHPAAGGTAPALGMMAFHHRFPTPPVGVGDRIQPDPVGVRKRTGQVGVGIAVGRAGDPVTERRRRRGQRNTDTVGQSVGDAPGGAGARLSVYVMPTLASAQLAGKRCPGTTAVNAGRPDHSTVSVGKCRSPICMPCCVARNWICYKYGMLIGSGPAEWAGRAAPARETVVHGIFHVQKVSRFRRKAPSTVSGRRDRAKTGARPRQNRGFSGGH